MILEIQNSESESVDDGHRIIKNNLSSKGDYKRGNRNNMPSSPSETHLIKAQCLKRSEDSVSNSSLNSDSSDNETNNNEIRHSDINKRSLLGSNNMQFRRMSSPAALGKKEQKQEYYTLQDYLEKNIYIRNSLSMQDSADMTELGTAMNYLSSSTTDGEGDNSKQKTLQRVRLFFIDYCVYKLILCLPFGFLTTISILGLKGDPINFVCYIIIFTLVVFYPIACVFWLLYKLLLPYYQMCRYTPNATSTEKMPEKSEGEIEYNVPTILTEKPAESNKSLSQTVYERRRSLPARRPSTLPAIEEDESTSDKEEESEDESLHKNNEKESHVREERIDIDKEQKHV